MVTGLILKLLIVFRVFILIIIICCGFCLRVVLFKWCLIVIVFVCVVNVVNNFNVV